MPYAPDIPPTLEVEGPKVSKNLDTFHIVALQIVVNPNDPAATTVRINWVKGYTDGGVFYPVENHNDLLQGEDVINKITENTTGGTIYNEVKNAAWEMLQARNLVPAGTIS